MIAKIVNFWVIEPKIEDLKIFQFKKIAFEVKKKLKSSEPTENYLSILRNGHKSTKKNQTTNPNTLKKNPNHKFRVIEK